MKKVHESDHMFIKNVHEKFYGKKKRREQRKKEEDKQLWLFDSRSGKASQ